MLSRSIKKPANLTITGSGQSLEARETFTREAGGPQDYKVAIKTEVKACNPGCANTLSW